MTATAPPLGSPQVQTMRNDRRMINWIVSRNRRRRLAAATETAEGITTENEQQLTTEGGDAIIPES